MATLRQCTWSPCRNQPAAAAAKRDALIQRRNVHAAAGAGWVLAFDCLPHASKPSALTRECTLLSPLSDHAGCKIKLLLLPRCLSGLASLGSSHGAVNTAGGCSACMLPACVPGLNAGTARQVCLAAQRPCGHGLAGASGAMAWGDGQQHSVHCSRSRTMAGGRRLLTVQLGWSSRSILLARGHPG